MDPEGPFLDIAVSPAFTVDSLVHKLSVRALAALLTPLFKQLAPVLVEGMEGPPLRGLDCRVVQFDDQVAPAAVQEVFTLPPDIIRGMARNLRGAWQVLLWPVGDAGIPQPGSATEAVVWLVVMALWFRPDLQHVGALPPAPGVCMYAHVHHHLQFVANTFLVALARHFPFQIVSFVAALLHRGFPVEWPPSHSALEVTLYNIFAADTGPVWARPLCAASDREWAVEVDV